MPTEIAPSVIMRDYLAGHVNPVAWLLYEHFALKCRDWLDTLDGDSLTRYEVINGTSSIRNWGPDPICSPLEVMRRLVRLFLFVDHPERQRELLHYCGINKWTDLDKPISFRARTPKRFAPAHWFELAHRRLKYPHNGFHPEAVWAQNGFVCFHPHPPRWEYGIWYGYEWDWSSRWAVSFKQGRESLWGFAGGVQKWIAEMLVEEDNWFDGSRRLAEVRDRRKLEEAVETLFYDDDLASDFRDKLVDAAMKRDGTSLTEHRVRLNTARKRTLLRWFP